MATRRTALDLVDRPFVFTQAPLLTRDEFGNAATRRGYGTPSTGPFEAEHKRGLLVPVYRLIRQLPSGSVPRGYPAARIAAGSAPRRGGSQLVGDRDSGRVILAANEPYLPRRRQIHRASDGEYEVSDFLYSRWQLLQLPFVRQFLRRESELRWRRSESARLLREWHQRELAQATDRNQELVVLLGALDPYYLPQVVRVASVPFGETPETYTQFEEGFDPVELLNWLGASTDGLQAEAEHLIHEADSLDPMRDWIDLVREIGPRRWDELRGDARIAMDHRIAAEMILLFLEDLYARAAAPALPIIPRLAPHPLHHRLGVHEADLDTILTDYELSPHPALVLVLEGPTEMLIVPRAMKVLGIPDRTSHIRLVNRGGGDVDDTLLVPYVALPDLGDPLTNSVRLRRPATRYLLVTDAEGRHHATVRAREATRARYVQLLLNALRNRDQESEPQLDRLVSIETWDQRQPTFEFAHFSDLQLARALIQLYAGTTAPLLPALRVAIRYQRLARRPLKRVWSDWPEPKPTKPALADLLWPLLQRRMRRAVRLGHLEDVPIARILVLAERMASEFPRSRLAWAVASPAREAPTPWQRRAHPACPIRLRARCRCRPAPPGPEY